MTRLARFACCIDDSLRLLRLPSGLIHAGKPLALARALQTLRRSGATFGGVTLCTQ